MLLNLAGILAFVVAFVPTSRPVLLCGASALPVDAVTDAAVVANVWALVVALVTARVASWWMYRRTGTSPALAARSVPSPRGCSAPCWRSVW